MSLEIPRSVTIPHINQEFLTIIPNICNQRSNPNVVTSISKNNAPQHSTYEVNSDQISQRLKKLQCIITKETVKDLISRGSSQQTVTEFDVKSLQDRLKDVSVNRDGDHTTVIVHPSLTEVVTIYLEQFVNPLYRVVSMSHFDLH